MTYPWFNFAVAIALGLLIGIERERTKGEGPARRPAGIRTFGLATLVGAIATHLGGIALLVVATGGVAVLAALSYVRKRHDDPGLTTDVALISAPLLGALAMSNVALASALAAVVAVILAAKKPIHGFVKGVLTESEMNDGLVLAIATLVIWPQLPNRYMGPFYALNPSKLWLVFILMLAIAACGHIAMRALGPRAGLPVSGFTAGFVSSTATIGSMAGRATRDPTTTASASAGATLSTVATFLQMALVLSAVSMTTLYALAPSLAVGGVLAAIFGTAFAVTAPASKDSTDTEAGPAFSIKTAVMLAAIMALMLVVAAGLKELLGEAGIVFGAGVAGVVDTHAAAVSVASLVASAKLAPQMAIVPILTAMSCNAASKLAMALSSGSRGFILRVVPSLVLSMAAAWAAALPTLLG